MAGREIVKLPLAVIFHPLFDGVGYDSDDCTIEYKRTDDEGDAADKQSPSVDTINIQIIKSIRIYQQIER